MRTHCDQKIKEILDKANKRVRVYCGPNYWFDYNLKDGKFWFIEKRGPMTNWVFPLDLNNHPLTEITDWEIYHAIKFLRGSRGQRTEKRFYENKEYKKWYPNA